MTVGYDGVNAVAPDTQASYWILAYETVPGGRLRVDGQYPDARYFSLTVQDVAAVTLGSLRDHQVEPDEGSANPFQGPVDGTADRRYTAYLDFTAPPSGAPAPNTLHVGETFEGQPNPGGSLIYRIYMPTDQDDKQAGAPLPDVSVEVGGQSIDLELEACEPLPPDVGGPGNETTSQASRPEVLPNLEPQSRDYRRTPNFVPLREAYFTEPVTKTLPESVADLLPVPRGIPLANVDFPYLSSSLTRAYGELVVVRMKAPTFPDTVGGEPTWEPTQTRYWSLCAYAAIDPEHGVHWLPWGPTNNDYLLYRIGVPDPDWEHDPGRIPTDAGDEAAAAQATMGEYYPVARYCTKATILDAGIDACFA